MQENENYMEQLKKTFAPLFEKGQLHKIPEQESIDVILNACNEFEKDATLYTRQQSDFLPRKSTYVTAAYWNYIAPIVHQQFNE